MKAFLIIVSLAMSSHADEFPVSPEQVAAWQESFKGLKRLAADQGTMDDKLYLETLANGLRSASRKLPTEFGDREGVQEILRQKIISIPGHADYFGDKVWKHYRRFQSGYEEGKGAFYYPVFANDGFDALQTLSRLPSPETIRVLGNMLKEDWKQPGFDEDAKRGLLHGTLGENALGALSKLPIAKPPSTPRPTVEGLREDMGVWRQWYSEIESGRRTFRFIGDDTEYDLRGPVRRGASEDRSRGAKRPAAHNETEEEPPVSVHKPIQFLPYALALAFLAVGMCYFIRRKEA